MSGIFYLYFFVFIVCVCVSCTTRLTEKFRVLTMGAEKDTRGGGGADIHVLSEVRTQRPKACQANDLPTILTERIIDSFH